MYIAMLLIENGAKTNVTVPDSLRYYRTPLTLAVYRDHVRIAEKLVTHGARVDVDVVSMAAERNYSSCSFTPSMLCKLCYKRHCEYTYVEFYKTFPVSFTLAT